MNTFVTNSTLPLSVVSKISGIKVPSIQEQQISKPKIDDVICHNLDGSALKEALFIIENIRENNMRIKWSAINVWSVQYKHKHVCNLKIERGSLCIGPVNDVLATRVTNMTYNQENITQLIGALRDSISRKPEAVMAMS